MVKLVSNSAALFHKTFVDSFMEKLKDAAETKLTNADTQQ